MSAHQLRCLQLDVASRHSKSASKGAQYLLYKAKGFDAMEEATADCDLKVAFTRWVAGRSNAFFDLSALMSHPTMQVRHVQTLAKFRSAILPP